MSMTPQGFYLGRAGSRLRMVAVLVVVVLSLSVAALLIFNQNADGADLRRQYVHRLIQDAPREQRFAVTDAVVTAEEVLVARNNTVDCLVEEGLDARLAVRSNEHGQQVVGIRNEDGQQVVGISIDLPGDRSATGPQDVLKPVDEIYDACVQRYSSSLEQIYRQQQDLARQD